MYLVEKCSSKKTILEKYLVENKGKICSFDPNGYEQCTHCHLELCFKLVEKYKKKKIKTHALKTKSTFDNCACTNTVTVEPRKLT